MSCELADIRLDFGASGIALNPISVDLRQNVGKDDYCSVKVTSEAARYTANNLRNREPVTFHAQGIPVYRGFIDSGGIQIGQTAGWLEIRDPLQILETGTVDREFHMANIKEIAEHIWEQVHDPHDVLTEQVFTTDISETMYQHDQFDGGIRIPGSSLSAQIQDYLADVSLIRSGDGRFDYRGETPREAYAELIEEFGTSMFSRANGQLVIGFPDEIPNRFSAGTHEGNWKLIDYSLPHQESPIGKVFVKGRLPEIQDGPISETPDRFTSWMKKAVPWAVASMKGYDGPPTLMDQADTGNKQKLEDIARQKLIKDFTSFHNGTFEVDVLASEEGPLTVGPLKVGDIVTVEEDQDCDIPGGAFRVKGFTHKFNPDRGWVIEFEVTRVVDFSSITTTSYEYNPKDEYQFKDIAETTELIFRTMMNMDGGLQDQTAEYIVNYDYQEGVDQIVDDTQDVVDGILDGLNPGDPGEASDQMDETTSPISDRTEGTAESLEEGSKDFIGDLFD